MNPFSMNYASLAGLEVPTSQAYGSPNSHSHVNPTNFFSRSTVHRTSEQHTSSSKPLH